MKIVVNLLRITSQMFSLKNMENRNEWLQWRKQGIGSSDAPIIMGVSPWSTLLQLYDDKTSEEINKEENYAMRLGTEMEPRVRALFEMVTGKSYEPKRVELAEFLFLRASLDGLSDDRKSCIEIKLSGKEDWENAKFKSIVPEKYIPQIQHQLMVTNCEVCFFVSYLYEKGMKNLILSPEKMAVVPVYPNLEYIKQLFKAECNFWEMVLNRTPPAACDKDFKPLTGLQRQVDEFRKLNLQIKELELLRDSYKEEILKKAEEEGHKRYLCSGIKVEKQTRKGNVQYKDIPELRGVDLEAYRGKNISFWSLK